MTAKNAKQPDRLEVHYAPRFGERRHIGSLALDRGTPVFECSAEWIANPLPIAPLTFESRAGLIAGPGGMPDRLHGLFADSLPDAWGHVLADRHFAGIGVARERVTVLDRLAFIGTRAMGALIYEPAGEPDLGAFTPDLDDLTDEAERVLSGTPTAILPQLIAAAGTSGGARPKILVGLGRHDAMVTNADPLPDGYEPFLVKLGSSRDGPDAAAVEFAYSRMAAAAGLRVGATRLLHGKKARYFATLRFDRGPGGARTHVLTASGLTDIPHEYFAVEYGELGGTIAKVCESYAEAGEFARRMAFNVLARNRDDHLKNTALLMDESGAWHVSPAYDLTLMPGPGGEHSMLVAGEGKSPTRVHLLDAAEAMGVERAPMRGAIDQVAAAVDRWEEFANEAELAAQRRKEIAAILKQTRREVLGAR